MKKIMCYTFNYLKKENILSEMSLQDNNRSKIN